MIYDKDTHKPINREWTHLMADREEQAGSVSAGSRNEPEPGVDRVWSWVIGTVIGLSVGVPIGVWLAF